MPGPFSPSAEFYDLVYSFLDYRGTADQVEAIIRERNPGASSLLDVSCGTGRHLAEWKDRFDHVEGVDIDEEMLAVARRRLGPAIPLHVADYTDFDLGRSFDAVTCLFSSIGYADTPERLDSAVANTAHHLSPGGVLVVEPWLRPGMISPPYLRTLVAEGEDMVVMRTTRHLFEGDEPPRDRSTMEFTYLVTTMEGSRTFTETHVMGLYPAERYVEAADKAGLDAEFDDQGTALGRGLLIGVRPSD
jgi:SAM-dependent methyltransferase